MRFLIEVVLALVALATILALRGDSHRFSADIPLIGAAAIGALGVAYGGSNETYIWALAAAAYAVTAVMFAARERAVNPVSPSPASGARLLWLWAMFIWFVAVDFAIGLDPYAHLLSDLLIACALGASVLLVAERAVTTITAARTGLIVVAVSDLLGLFSHPAWRSCDQFKCTRFGGLYLGPYPSENFLALLATMTFAWTLVATRGRLRMTGGLLCALTVLATGSRTGLIVSALSLAAVVATTRVWPQWPGARVRELSWPITGGVCASVAIVGIYALDHAQRTTFSNRGQVWLQALQMVDSHRLAGVGLSSYRVLQLHGLVSRHFTHSEYLLLLFAGGYVGVALFVGWATVTMRALARSEQSVIAVVPVVAFITYGWTEATWNPLAFDSFAWIMLALTLAVSETSTQERVTNDDDVSEFAQKPQ